MELSQKYAYEVYRLNSFSKAAKKFFISQPSLSAMIKKLEKELGFKIFDRSKNPLILTPEGKIYVRYLEDCLENEKLMRDRIKTLSKEESIELIIGGGSFFSCAIYPEACRRLREKFPNLTIRLDLCADEQTNKVADKLEAGVLDLGIQRNYDSQRFAGTPILEERYFLALRKDIKYADQLIPYDVGIEGVLQESFSSRAERDDYKIPEGMRLVRPLRYPESYAVFREFISQFEVANTTIVNFRSNEILYDMMLKGHGAVIVSDILIASKRDASDGVIFIPINHPKNTKEVNVIHKKRAQLSAPAKEFIAILKSMCENKSKFMKNLADKVI